MPSLPPVPVAFRVPVSEGYADEGPVVRTSAVRMAVARSLHAHQLCCGLALEYCPVQRDLILEAALVIQDLKCLGYRVRATPTRRGAA